MHMISFLRKLDRSILTIIFVSSLLLGSTTLDQVSVILQVENNTLTVQSFATISTTLLRSIWKSLWKQGWKMSKGSILEVSSLNFMWSMLKDKRTLKWWIYVMITCKVGLAGYTLSRKGKKTNQDLSNSNPTFPSYFTKKMVI